MAIIVQKYGGTSVGSVERIYNVARRVMASAQAGHQVAVVVSAMGDTTDELVSLVKSVSQNPSEREMAMVLSTGEQISIALLATALQELGCPAMSFTGAQAGVVTEGSPLSSRIIEFNAGRVKDALQNGKVAIVAGFQGADSNGEINTLGRGGSDTTAVALAAALGADTCEIYTDVDGVYTIDPRIVPEAAKLTEITYDEMLELASMGAKVLHPRAVECGKLHCVTIHVRSSFHGEEGTLVKGESNLERGTVISGIACDENQVKIAVVGVPDKPGMAARIFAALGEAQINVDLIVQSIRREGENDILFTVPDDDLAKARATLEPIVAEIGATELCIQSDVAKISVVGAGMVQHSGVAAGMFQALAAENINIEIISTSEIRISCLIAQSRLQDAARAIHQFFQMDKHPEKSNIASCHTGRNNQVCRGIQ
ncbi:aspartate kinase [Dethiobacter alkaliphilus]|uniref:Aspartokinase n=1 Tax=Dethiobacter alkaliphilus AHT 1 TaxID=555088 RepID=C0GCS3_DETAL|nr:aspartate kinase [Dethiobacter alkaliphilus]EEG79008.1 aspartate kinase [Dethiobacter alkaliphilus AHT 1]